MEATPSPEFAQLVETIRAFQRSRALTVAAELGVADLLRNGPRTAHELADATGTHAPALHRPLRALASLVVFHEDEQQQQFSLTATGQYLRTDHPLSADPLARFFGADYEWKAWGELRHSVRTGENAAIHALSVDVWEHRRHRPEDSAIFDAAMRILHTPGPSSGPFRANSPASVTP